MASRWISLAEAARRLQMDADVLSSWGSAGRVNIERDEEGREGVSDLELARLARLSKAVRGDYVDSAGADLSDSQALADSSHLARAEADSGATMLEESSILGGTPERPVEVRTGDPDSQVLSEDEKIPDAVRRMMRRGKRGAPAEADDDAPVEVFGDASSLNTGVLRDDADRVGDASGGSQTSLSESELLSDLDEDENETSSTSINSRAAPPAVPDVDGYADDSLLGGDALSLPMDFETAPASPASLDPPARKSAAMPDNFDDDDSLFGNLEEPTKKPASKKGGPPPSGDAMNTAEDDLLLHAPDLDDGLAIPPLEDPSMHLGHAEGGDREMSISLDEGMLSPLAGQRDLDGPAFDLGPSPPSDYASDMSMSIEIELERPGRKPKEAASASDGDLDLTPLSGASGIDLEGLLSSKSDVPAGDEPTLDLLPSRKDRNEAMLDLESLTLEGAAEDATEVTDPRTSVLNDSGSSSMSSGGSSLQLGNEIQAVGAVSGVNLDRDSAPSAAGGSDVFSLVDAPSRSAASASLVNLGEVTDEDDFVLDGGGGSDVTLRPSESGIGIGAGQSGIGLLARGDSGIDLAGGLDLGSTTMGAVQADSEFLLEPMEEGETDEGSSSGSQVIALDDGGEPGMAPMLGPDDGGGVMLPGDGFGYPGASGVGMGMQPGMAMGGLPTSPSLVGGGMATGMTAPSPVVQPVVEYDDGIRYDGWDMFLFVTCAVLGLTSAIMAYELIAVTVLGQRAFTIDWLMNPTLQTPPGEILHRLPRLF